MFGRIRGRFWGEEAGRAHKAWGLQGAENGRSHWVPADSGVTGALWKGTELVRGQAGQGEPVDLFNES